MIARIKDNNFWFVFVALPAMVFAVVLLALVRPTFLSGGEWSWIGTAGYFWLLACAYCAALSFLLLARRHCCALGLGVLWRRRLVEFVAEAAVLLGISAFMILSLQGLAVDDYGQRSLLRGCLAISMVLCCREIWLAIECWRDSVVVHAKSRDLDFLRGLL